MSTVSDGIHRDAEPCRHPDTYRCSEACECLCGHCWDKRHAAGEAEGDPELTSDVQAVFDDWDARDARQRAEDDAARPSAVLWPGR